MSDIKWFVIDPTADGDCYGKYGRRQSNIPEHWEDIVEVERSDLDDYNVVEWRYA